MQQLRTVIKYPGAKWRIADWIIGHMPEHHSSAFCRAMKELGYEYEFKILKACDFGAPTSRERLFGIFRNDGKSIVRGTGTFD